MSEACIFAVNLKWDTNMTKLEHAGRVAVITGAARGFGKAFAHALAKLGADVFVADIDAEAGRAAAAEIGPRAHAFACDVADETQVNALVAEAVSRFGGIDMFVNNAGLHSAEYNRPTAELGLAKVRRLFDVNLMGVIACSLAARPAMANRPNASFVNISSVGGDSNGNTYGVSKLAVRGLTMMFAREFAPEGIRVNAIAPGLIFTDTIRAELAPATVSRVLDQQLLKREGEERDIVEALLYLVSDRASFVTGETLRVSGGFCMKI
jgi:NAD(P)-dependent dehydrogenase (short-subunit alcohol dehydrogenase family)